MNTKTRFILKLMAIVFVGISSGFSYFSAPEMLVNEDLAKQGDSLKQYELGTYYLNTTYSSHYRCVPGEFSTVICEGIETMINNNEIQSTYDRGLYWLRKSSNSGNINAKYKLAMALQKSDYSLSIYARKQKLSESKSLLEQLVNEGYAAANYQLGWYYLRGIGVDVDYVRAIEYLKVAKEKNYPKAKSLLEIALNESKGIKRVSDK